MSEEIHPVVELLLARMKSHPEEFQAGMNRWDFVLHKVLDNGNEAETTAINEGLRPIHLAEVHEWMMDELCNGDERRRKEQEEAEYEKRLMARQAMRISANGSVGIGSATPSTTLAVTTARHPTSSDMDRNGIMNALRNIK